MGAPKDVRIWRDVYYTRPRGTNTPWGFDAPYQLSGEEYFVLGDNSDVSDDSRTWAAGPAVPAALIYGKPLVLRLGRRDWEDR